MIGKYALENGNIRAIKKFKEQYPNLKESSIRNYKRLYKRHLEDQRKKANTQAVTEIASRPRGCPPLLLENDEKLLTILRAVRARGGVVNSNVVRGSAQALLEASSMRSIELPRTWVNSVYRRLGFVKRMATTSRPPIPKGLFEECRIQFLRDINNAVKNFSIPPELVLNSDPIFIRLSWPVYNVF